MHVAVDMSLHLSASVCVWVCLPAFAGVGLHLSASVCVCLHLSVSAFACQCLGASAHVCQCRYCRARSASGMAAATRIAPSIRRCADATAKCDDGGNPHVAIDAAAAARLGEGLLYKALHTSDITRCRRSHAAGHTQRTIEFRILSRPCELVNFEPKRVDVGFGSTSGGRAVVWPVLRSGRRTWAGGRASRRSDGSQARRASGRTRVGKTVGRACALMGTAPRDLPPTCNTHLRTHAKWVSIRCRVGARFGAAVGPFSVAPGPIEGSTQVRHRVDFDLGSMRSCLWAAFGSIRGRSGVGSGSSGGRVTLSLGSMQRRPGGSLQRNPTSWRGSATETPKRNPLKRPPNAAPRFEV